ncbi:hypothetical protein N9R81_05245 [Flavobacteriales bacterium]|nr:hypothetical protein [Flavobacteriales bacterium]
MKKLFVILFISTIYFGANAQQRPSDWTLIQTLNDVEIHYKYAQCQPRIGYDQELVLLKFKNNSSTDEKIVTWELEAIRNGVCTTCNKNNEYHMTLNLSPAQIKEGNCSIECDYRLKIFSKFNEGIADEDQILLESFKLTNLNIID